MERGRRLIPVLVAAVVAVVVGLLVAGHHSSAHHNGFGGGNNGGGNPTPGTTGPGGTTAPASSTTTQPIGTPSATATPAVQVPGTPQYVAAQYESAAHHLSYEMPGKLSGWVPAVRPYVTAAYYAKLVAQARAAQSHPSAGDDAYWQQIQAEHEVVFVRIASAQIPAGVGRDANHVIVAVLYTLAVRTDANPDPSSGQLQLQAESCQMVRTSQGWLVAAVSNGGG